MTKLNANTKTARVKKSQTSMLEWDYGDDLVPRVGLPDADRMARRQKWMRRYIKSSVYLLPITLVLTMLVALSNVHPLTTSPMSNGSASSSPGRTVATLALEQWLAETPSPLPHAMILSWDGARDIAPAPVQASTGQSAPVTWTAELDTFTLVVGSPSKPTLYSAVIEVALKPGGGAVALSGPSLSIVTPTNTTSGWDTGGPWSGINTNSGVTTAVQSAIDGWTAAFTSGSGSQLRLAVGDTRGSVHYVAMSDIASATDTVVASATRVAPNLASTATSTNPSAEIVEVTLNLLWRGEKVSAFGSSSGPQTTMDLLLERANTAAPVVVAWGPPGSGPGLTPYQNAVGN